MIDPPKLDRRALVVLLGVVLATSACSYPAHARTGPDSFAPLVRRVLPAVVNIQVTETVVADGSADLPAQFQHLPPELQRQLRARMQQHPQQMQGAGSGFIIDPSGYIVTNNHVVNGADKIIVGMTDGTELPARVIGVDPLTDIALIKVSATRQLPFVTFGDSSHIEVGDWVVAAGNPFGLGGSITAGIVSARGRNIGEGPFDDFIQIDAPINPGNSGGPVFDEDGTVVGMNTAIVSPTGGSVGIGFAIPAEIAKRIVGELRHSGHVERGWLGVSVEDVDADGLHGAGIAGVDRSGPAARAGLRAGDVVTGVNGVAVDSSNSLIKAVSAVPPGGSLKLTVHRSDHDLEIPVSVGRRPDGSG